MIARALLAGAVVFSLAGCTSMFAPDPTATASSSPAPSRTFASVSCEPTSTQFSWSTDAPQVDYRAISTHFQSFDNAATAGSGGSTDAAGGEYALALDSGASLFAQVSDDQEKWNPVLLRTLLASTLAPPDIGVVSGAIDTSEFLAPKPHTGTWVRVVVAPQELYGFTMTCQDGTTATGSFGGIVPTGAKEYVLHCDDKQHPNDSAMRAVARSECQSHP